MEKLVEVEKIVEVIKEIEVVREEENCDCLTGVRFIDVWNKLFHLEGVASAECMTEEEFVSLVSKNF